MSAYGFLAFCTVYTIAVATPGPGVAALLARTLAHGMRGTAAYIAGFLVGDLIWFVGAAAGLLNRGAATALTGGGRRRSPSGELRLQR